MAVVGAVELEEETSEVVAEEAETSGVVVGGDEIAFGPSGDGETNSASVVELRMRRKPGVEGAPASLLCWTEFGIEFAG
jgi:hypothetical protein